MTLGYELQDPNGDQWTQQAHTLIRSGALKVGVVENGKNRLVVIEGECPRCQHFSGYEKLLSTVTLGYLTAEKIESGPYDEVTVPCLCAGTHAGAPEGKKGCGINYLLRVGATR